LVRTKVEDVSVVGRNTQGVRLIKLGKGENLTQLERIESMDDEDEVSDEGVTDNEASDDEVSNNGASESD